LKLVRLARIAPARPATGRGRERPRPGFGIVEVMVGLVLGLLVVGAASLLFLGTRQASRATDNLSRMQESQRTSFDLMARELREAGGTPCDAQVGVANLLVNAQGATPVWWASWAEPIRGFDGAAAFDGAAIGTGVAARVAGTDAVLVRFAADLGGLTVTAHNTATATLSVGRAAHGLRSGDLLLVCNYRQGSLFQASSAVDGNPDIGHAAGVGNPGNCAAGLGLPALCAGAGTTYSYAPGARLGRWVASGWYIGNNGRPDTGGHSLYRVTRSGPEEVAEGVRDMQIGYLVTDAADYVSAAAVTDWSRVTAARVDLIFEAVELGGTTTATVSRASRRVGYTASLRNLMP
jgi:type IV pilus assembly protein PilW